MSNKPVQSVGVTNTAFRGYMLVIALVVGLLAYMAGNSAGKSKTKYEAAQRDLSNQKEVFTNDLLLQKQMPDSRDTTRWADGMRDRL